MIRPDASAAEALAAVRSEYLSPREQSPEGPQTHVVLDEQRGRRVPALLILAGLALSCVVSLHGIYGSTTGTETGAVVSASKTLVSLVIGR